MSGGSDQSAPDGATAGPGLIILTGASHTGKTSVSRALLPLLRPPIALLSVDEVLEHVLARSIGDLWQEIPLAYDLLEAQTNVLLGRGWTIVLESTFTYVPEQGPPEFHGDAIKHMTDAARKSRVPYLVAQLTLDPGEAVKRSEDTERLPPEIVAQTIALHDRATMPTPSIRLATGGATPEELARGVLDAFRRLS